MTDKHTIRRRFRSALAGTALAAALLAGVPALAGTAVAAPAEPAAAARAAVTRPGAPRDLQLTATPGGGARTISYTASWRQPDLHGGTSPRYLVALRDDIGRTSEQTTTDTSLRLFGDYCVAPFTVTVRTQTTDPRTGRTLTGPGASGTFGRRDLCDITMSITAVPGTARGTIDVTLHQDPPLDPFVSGPCTLYLDGVPSWSGTCGGARGDQEVSVRGTSGRPYDVVLRTTTPRNRVLESNHVRTDPS